MIRSLSRALVGCFVLLSGCGDAPPRKAPSALERVRLQLNWVPEPEFGGIYAAELAGFFKDEGLEVEIIKGGPGVAAPQLAAAGKVEFAVVGGEQILTLREQGGNLVGLFAMYQDDPMGVMVHEASPIRSLEELWKSKTVVACETNLSWVKTLDARVGKASVTFVPHTGSLAEFAANPARAQQCFIFAEPVALELQGVRTRVFLSKESGFNPYNAVVATNESYAKAHPATCDKLVRALRRGWKRYLDNPDATNRHMSTINTAMTKQAMDMGAARQAPLITSADTEALGLGAMTAERWAAIAQQLKTLGTIKEAPVPESLFRRAPPVIEDRASPPA